jgi:hypothetical protein
VCRGYRIEVRGFTGYDVIRGAEFLGQSWMTAAYFKIDTANAGNAAFPFAGTAYWESWPIKV